MDKKKISLVVLFVVFVAGILTISLLPKTATAPTKTPILTPTPIPEICKQFEGREVVGEISCSQAIDKALSLYPGKVTDIVMASNLKKSDQGPNEPGIQAWRIAILLDQPVEENGETMTSIRITLDRATGNVFSQYFFK